MRLEDEDDVKTLKDSVLSTDAPPTYQMAIEYLRAYAEQYYIGTSLSVESEIQPKMSDQEKPPEYHSIVPY